MNSHNHPMFGSVGAWLYKALAGINLAPGSTGFDKLRIAPQMVRDLRHAAGSVETYRGTVSSSWSRGDGSVRLEAVVPVGTAAEVVLPRFNLKNVRVKESGQTIWDANGFQSGAAGVEKVEEEQKNLIIRIGSGRYSFELTGD